MKGFPSSLSIFLSTYDPVSGKQGFFASCPVGKVIPLYPKDRLHLVGAPNGGFEVPPAPVISWDMPDFPPISTSNEDAFDDSPASQKRKDKIERVYNEVEELEPGTSRWINLQCDKIGGYHQFIQNDLALELTRSQPKTRWQVIATYAGDEINLGDAGMLYVLTGWDENSKKRRWHCEWQGH